MDRAITARLGFEDEIVSSTAVNLFLPDNTSSGSSKVDPRRAQLDLVGFLGEQEAAEFAKELWEMMLDAQEAPGGIPRKLLEEKKRELAEAKIASEVAAKQKSNAVQRSQPMRPANPEANEIVQVAARRAEAARQAFRGRDNGVPERRPHHPMGAEDAPPTRPAVPVSPPRKEDEDDRDGGHEERRKRMRRDYDRDDFGREPRSREHSIKNDDKMRSHRRDRDDRAGRREDRGRYDDNKDDRRNNNDYERHRRRHNPRNDDDDDNDRDDRRQRRKSEEHGPNHHYHRRERDEGHRRDDSRRERSRDYDDDDERRGGRRSHHGSRDYNDEKRSRNGSRKRDRRYSDDDSR